MSGMCNKSETIGKIAAALVAFSGEVKSIAHDSTNPHFKSQYTSLDHMIDETKPLLTKHGLTVMQFPGGDGERITMRTMILHTSGEWIESEPLTLKAVKMDPQGAGSAITYARRYSYAAALSLSLGDDDDGNATSHAPQGTQRAPQGQAHNPSGNRSQAPTGQPSASSDAISQAQVGMIKRLLSEKKITDERYREILNGYEVGSSKDLSKRDASALIKQLQEYVPDIVEEPLPF